MPEDPKTTELRADQIRRFRREALGAELADDDLEIAEHERRRDRSAYLAGKLDERAAAERER